MTNALTPGQYFGSRSIERSCAGFTAALRRGTIPQEQVHEHSHEGAHFVLAIDAGYLTGARGAEGLTRPATLIYNPPGTVHRDRFMETGRRFISIDVPGAATPAGSRDALVIEDRDAVAAAMRATGLIAGGTADDLAIEELMLRMLAGVPGGGAAPRALPGWLTRAAEALNDLSGEATLEIRQVARIVGVHSVHLARAWRRHFGHGPSEAVRRLRVARAAELLGRGAALAEIALAAGFADQSHMTRAFRRDLGVTPAKFRAAFA